MILRVLCLVALCLCISACDTPADIIVESGPLLQIDAVFIAGAPMPDIVVRRTFNITGTDVRNVGPSDLYAEGATVRLKQNGIDISTRETSPGRFESDQDVFVEMNDVYSITVNWKELEASAVARVPSFQTDKVTVSTSTAKHIHTLVFFDREQQKMDSLDVFQSRVEVHLASPAPFQLIRTIGVSTLELLEELSLPGLRMPEYRSFDLRNEPAGDLSIEGLAEDLVPRREDWTASGAEIIIDMLVPEPIYADYMRNESDFFTPVTITNVDGGVGLFIGAIHHRFVETVAREW